MANKKGCIVLENISKSYKTGETVLHILKDLNFTVTKGEKIAVTGASGIGKSTLLHVLGGLDHPDHGKIFIEGEDIYSLSDEKVADIRNRKIGFMFQFHHLLPEFNAVENVMMPSLISGIDKKTSLRKAEDFLKKVGLSKRMKHKVTELSGGEQQRVALARALIMDPIVLLADEPTGNLDRKNSADVHMLLEELNRELEMTLIVVTHNMELASLMDKQVTLKEGSLVSV
ncbi:MAG: ABC transporter ATP-binding protein [Desulfobacteraceae bacterium]|nr:ABC transporter ATP-binding protein [Desulfobacteraceae bacterium]MCB9494847.1 ABC transporter ATP-binding protein [Desulfobacteraceae bacterium]